MKNVKFLNVFLLVSSFGFLAHAEDRQVPPFNFSTEPGAGVIAPAQAGAAGSIQLFNQNGLGDLGWGVRLSNSSPSLSAASPIGLNLGQSGEGFAVRENLRNWANRNMAPLQAGLNMARRAHYNLRFGNTPVGDSNIQESSLDKNLAAYCDHLLTGKPDHETPAGCTHDGINALDKCDLGGIISENDLFRMKRALSVSEGNKKESCIASFKSLASKTLSVAGHIAQATVQFATNVIDQPHFDIGTSAAECSRGGGDAPAGTGKLEACNDFNNTPMAGSETTGFMSKFISDFDGFGNFTKIFMLRGTIGECEACFADKYKTIQQASNLPDNNFDEQYKKKLTEAKLNVRVRKAEQALSEYVKFQERNQFMSRFMHGQPETCGNIAELSRLKRGCDPDQAKQVLDKIAQRHGVRPFNNDLTFFVNTLRSRHMSKLAEPVLVPECGEKMRVTHSSYLAAYQTQVSTAPMQPSLLFTSNTTSELAKCDEYDQRCMLNVMTSALTKHNGGNEAEARKTITSFFRQPFYRTLLTHRDSLLEYAKSGDIGEGNDFAKYKEANKDRLSAMASRDAEVACKAFGNDFMMALCVTDSDLSDSYSGQGLKEELADMLASHGPATAPGDSGKNLINLTVACNMLGTAGNYNSEINESQAITDKSFDRLELADSFLRNDIRQPSRLSQKRTAFVENFAKKMCDDALIERRKLEVQQMMAQQTPVSIPSPLNCTGFYVLSNLGDCVFNVMHRSQTSPDLGFSRIYEPPTSNLGRNYLSRIGTNIFEGPSSEIDFSDMSSESSRYDLGFKTTSLVNAPNLTGVLAEESKLKTGGAATESTTAGGDFVRGVGQIGSQMNQAPMQQALVPTWTMPIPETAASRAPASSGEEGEELSPSDRRRGTSERALQEVEARQAQIEQQVLDQARETQTIQDLKNQAQIEQLRVELQKLQLSNKQLMANLQKISAPRKTQAEENIFDQVAEAEEDEELVEESREVPLARPTARTVAATTQAKIEASSSLIRPSVEGASIPSSGTKLPEQVKVGAATSGVAAASVNVAAARGGTQAASSRGVVASSGSNNFVPSLSLQKTISADSVQETLPQEKRIELLKEFLSYVEKNPEYRDGRYLSSENDRVTIEYEGRTVVLSLGDIQDAKARAHLQERLVRQRVAINQYVRASRLENLKRLLASSRAQQ